MYLFNLIKMDLCIIFVSQYFWFLDACSNDNSTWDPTAPSVEYNS